MTPLSSRAAAAIALGQVLFGGQSLTAVLARTPCHLSAQDQALIKELCFGVCRLGHQLQAVAKGALNKPIKAKEHEAQALLLIGLYQLLHMRVPDHAAINSTVNAAKELKRPWAAGLINGVLRSIQRKIEANEALWVNSESANHAHPKWMINALKKDWPQQWQAITEANNTQAPMTLRVNAQKIGLEAYEAALISAGQNCQHTQYSPHGLTLTQACAVTSLPGFTEGQVSVQDEAAQLSAELMTLEPGFRVLDACAAPGGKTCHLLESQPALSHLLAIELEPERLERIKENTTRLGFNPTVLCADAANVSQWWDGKQFDRILLDAPCSASGVIRRHPDIKWLRRAADIDKLAELQQSLLQALWPTLKPGGLLLYATCSVFKQENTHNVQQFLHHTANATHEPIEAPWGEPLRLGRQLLPKAGAHDGFYYAHLRKNEA